MSTAPSFAYGSETYRLAFGPPPEPFDPVNHRGHRFGNFCHISYGLHFEEACAEHVSQTFGSSRVYILASGSLERHTDALERLERALDGKVVGKFVGMKSHTLWSEVLKVVNECRELQADLIVTLGGGSLTDGAKLITIALENGVEDVNDLRRLPTSQNPYVQGTRDPTIPIICVPTTLSGGEYSTPAGATEDATHEKISFFPPKRFSGPRLVILDPELTATTPDSIWLSTGIRAVDHCVETLCSLVSNPQSDQSAERGLRQLIPGLLRCKKAAGDIAARFACQMGVLHAIHAVWHNYVPLGGSHAIGHQLGPLGVGHGETSCILLPAVCKFNAKHGANVERQRNVSAILWGIPEMQEVAADHGLSVEQADLGEMIGVLVRALGLPSSLKEVNVGRDQLEKLAKNSLGDIWSQSNPVPLVEKEQVMEILNMVAE